MALTELTTEAMEEAAYAIYAAFTDENGDAVTPNANTIKWTLTTNNGTIINSRDYEAAASATSVTITLGGSDLAIQTGETAPVVRRRLTIMWEYNSDLGLGLKGKSEVIFPIRNLTRLPAVVP